MHLFVHVLLEIHTVFVPDFDTADMKRVDDGLYRLGLIAWGSCECQKAEVRVLRHQESNTLCVGVIPCASMRFVCNFSY
jgi:hypothetical protein